MAWGGGVGWEDGLAEGLRAGMWFPQGAQSAGQLRPAFRG